MTDSAIKLSGIDKSFGPVRANRGAELDVARGEIHALVGENGAGKSTLMKILSGVYEKDSALAISTICLSETLSSDTCR